MLDNISGCFRGMSKFARTYTRLSKFFKRREKSSSSLFRSHSTWSYSYITICLDVSTNLLFSFFFFKTLNRTTISTASNLSWYVNSKTQPVCVLNCASTGLKYNLIEGLHIYLRIQCSKSYVLCTMITEWNWADVRLNVCRKIDLTEMVLHEAYV